MSSSARVGSDLTTDVTEGRSEISGPPSFVLRSRAGGYFPVPVSVAETVDGSEVPSPVTTSVAV